MWRRIRLRYVNAVLFSVIAGTAIVYWQELSWAREELPLYWEGAFSNPPERQMYLDARDLLRVDREDSRAASLLAQSVAIDPNGEAAYWIARRLYDEGQDAEALEALTDYIKKDPTRSGAHVRIAEIHQRQGRPERARQTLERARGYFAAQAEMFDPQPDRTVGRQYNEKAEATRSAYLDAVDRLQSMLDELDAPAAADP